MRFTYDTIDDLTITISESERKTLHQWQKDFANTSPSGVAYEFYSPETMERWFDDYLACELYEWLEPTTIGLHKDMPVLCIRDKPEQVFCFWGYDQRTVLDDLLIMKACVFIRTSPEKHLTSEGTGVS